MWSVRWGPFLSSSSWEAHGNGAQQQETENIKDHCVEHLNEHLNFPLLKNTVQPPIISQFLVSVLSISHWKIYDNCLSFSGIVQPSATFKSSISMLLILHIPIVYHWLTHGLLLTWSIWQQLVVTGGHYFQTELLLSYVSYNILNRHCKMVMILILHRLWWAKMIDLHFQRGVVGPYILSYSWFGVNKKYEEQIAQKWEEPKLD